MEYIGEHPFFGQLGHSLIILSFVFAAFSAVSYFFAARSGDRSWKRWGRIGFYLHSVAGLSAIGLLFYMFDQQMIEYEYIHSHTNSSMPKKFIMVAFWGGQQGSLLLWTFWHIVLGNILIHVSKSWEDHVMTVFSTVQFFVLSCLLGIYIGDWKIGESPFMLWRQTDMGLAPYWREVSDYMKVDPMFKDGAGLNLTLMNYWMTIHPPTLFLGFSATLVPFCFAIAGLWRKQFVEWIKPAMPWTLLAAGVLGLGILMGGAWAYESLTFGGFWAWDPVENASLVPWLVLVGAFHTMIIAKKRNTAIFTSIVLTTLSFILVLLSTFLTRSGILGDTSVHSFTDNGMLNQLLLFIVVFTWMTVAMIIQDSKAKRQFIGVGIALFLVGLIFDMNAEVFGEMKLKSLMGIIGFASVFFYSFIGYKKGFPKPDKEEELLSREFWMFIGSLILLGSAIHIIVNTSIPAFNELFGSELAPKSSEQRIEYYNQWQIPFAGLLSILIAVGQYFKYKNSDIRTVGKKLIIPVIITAAIVIPVFMRFDFEEDEASIAALAVMSSFAIGANIDYWLRILKGKLGHAGASIAHIGFGLILLGTVLSQGKQEVISQNSSGHLLQNMSDNMDNQHEALVYREDTSYVNKYFVSFSNKESEGLNIRYTIEFFRPETRSFSEGDTVRYMSEQGTVVLRALQDHEASDNVITDINNGLWEGVDDSLIGNSYFDLPWWEPKKPGSKAFTVSPFVQTSPKPGSQSLSVEPGTKHYWDRDVFTYLKIGELTPTEREGEHFWMKPAQVNRELGLNDSLMISRYLLSVDDIFVVPDSLKQDYFLLEKDSAIAVRISVREIKYGLLDYRAMTKDLLYIEREGEVIPDEVSFDELGIRFSFAEFNLNTDSTSSVTFTPSNVSFRLGYSEKEYIVYQAIIFPYINILWIGCIIMVIGTLIAMVYRIRMKFSKQDGRDS